MKTERFTCPNCGSKMIAVKVISDNETAFFWDCFCTTDLSINEDYDVEYPME